MLVRFDIIASGSISLTGYYCYDHTGNRLKKIVKNQQGNLDVTTYIGSMERRTSISGTTTTTKVAGLADFQRGNHPEEWNKDVWHTTDHLGTVTLHLSNQGYVLKKSYYTPFGETAGTEDSKSRYRYCGKEKDGESGLYYYGARYYAAWLCRFVSVDPLGEKYAQLSSYNYCKNSPQNYVDRDGKEPIRIFLIPLSIPIIIVSSTKPKKPSQWYEFNYITDQESFNEAAEYNTKHLNHEAYQSVFQRNDYYEWADSKLKGYGVRWFGAAEIVTRYDSVGGAEFPDFGAFTSSEVDSFLKEGNKYLFSQNIENTKKIIEGKGKLDLNFTDAKGAIKSTKGKLGHDLDNLLVEFEQSKLQEFIGKYKSTVSSSEWGSMINEINSLFTSPLAQSDVKSAIENLFPKGGINGSFNFLNYDHRVLLGKYLVEKLHATDTPKPKSN